MHCPGQVKKGLVCSNCIHGPLGDYLRFERWKELRKPTKEKLRHYSANIACYRLGMLYYDSKRCREEFYQWNSGRNSIQPSRIYFLGTINICAKFYVCPSSR